MSEGLIAVQNTAPQYLKGAADNTIRNRLWLSLLRQAGRIKLGRGSFECTWNVKFSQPEVRQNGDAGQQTFAEHDAFRQLTLDWRGYVATDRLTLKKKLMNDDDTAIVNLYDTKMEDLVTGLENEFGGQLYVDGNAANNENAIHGIKSFLGYTACTTADIIAQPNDTYAGRSTVLGTLGGSWSSDLGTSPNAGLANDWPYGSGGSEYDYLAPKLINYNSTGFPAATAGWSANCTAVLRRARTWCASTGGSDMVPYCHMLGADLYDEFEDHMESKQRLMLPHKGAQDLGFDDVLNFNGAMIKHEFDCPASEGFGVNFGEMILESIHDEFFYSYGPDWDLPSLSYLFLVGFFGNMKCNPKHFARYGDLTS